MHPKSLSNFWGAYRIKKDNHSLSEWKKSL